ncbi:hypothetical protein HBI56_169460 [Parastagonospora nodorum]|nr:hypothetical protein HBH46_055120 [Parastagonospora nodorum]KAH4176546.1 hypothetical protein HBH43_060400 [Parastagonospora nodorum]KAH4220437.1 hypothetical protein HBI06_172840 [Parastagonospora nodorum]KAH4232736.1 hypothetical protein HBI05_169810 [Parastagonospora nodorum]KAH4846122.1 hypothetical protein HBH75_174140 [Parastagonospora nodorum]
MADDSCHPVELPDSMEVPEKALSLGDALSESIVTVEIGPDQKKYYVHKALLVHHSEYFKRALRGAWKEAHKDLVTIEDVEPVVFNIFLHWLYTQQIPNSLDYEEWDQVMGTKGTSDLEDAMTRVQAYSFGDRFLVPNFRRTMNEAFVDMMVADVLPDPSKVDDLVVWAFENVPSDRPLLQLLVNQFCDDWNNFPVSATEIEALKTLPGSFLARVVTRYNQLKNYPNNDIQCCYLEHTDYELESCTKTHMVFDPMIEYGSFN